MRALSTLLVICSSLVISSCGALTTDSMEVDPQVAEGSFYDMQVTSLEGEPVDLGQYRGQVTLVVNTASECGYTSQYEGLQELQDEYGESGFSVLGFPSGDFGGQEFEQADEIRAFCDSEFAVSFPLFAKTHVKEGADQSEVYKFLGKASGSLPGWNFGKYLLSREGKVITFFATPVEPTDEEIREAIEVQLQ